MKALLLAAGLLFTAPVTAAQDLPPAGYENAGVCPFECCTYRAWTAGADIPVHAQRSDASPVLFHLRPDETLQGVSGVVVTDRPGVIEIDRPIRDGYVSGSDAPQLSLKPGDVVYQLAPLGEGSFLFWFHGRVYASSTDMPSTPAPGAGRLKTTWWKQVRNRAGQVGWTRSDAFRNVDACG